MIRIYSALILILASAMPLACGKVYNSSTYDASTYGSADGSPQFLAAKDIIKTNCASCHTRPSHQAWAGLGEKDFISQNLITPGNLAGSVLYTKIQGNRSGTAGNMPNGGTLLTTAQIITMENWILNIAP